MYVISFPQATQEVSAQSGTADAEGGDNDGWDADDWGSLEEPTKPAGQVGLIS